MNAITMTLMLEAAVGAIWQGALLAALTAVAMRFVPKLSAATRHRLWWGVLVVSIALPVVVVGARRGQWTAPITSSAGSPVSATGDAAADVKNAATEQPVDGRSLGNGMDTFRPLDLSASAPASLTLPAIVPVKRNVAPTVSLSASRPVVVMIVLTWLFIAMGMLSRISVGLRRLHALQRAARPLGANIAARIHARLGNAVNVPLLVSDDITVPVALGFRSRAIVFPAGMVHALSDKQLEHVLLHELAHLTRRDDWGTLLLRVAQSLFFFLPSVHFVARRIEFEQEMACDDWALSFARADARDYAESLVRVGELAVLGLGVERRLYAVTPSAGTQLARRIGGLLARKSDASVENPVVRRMRVLVLPLPVVAAVLLSAYAPLVTIVPAIDAGERNATRSKSLVGNATDATKLQVAPQHLNSRTQIDSVSRSVEPVGSSTALPAPATSAASTPTVATAIDSPLSSFTSPVPIAVSVPDSSTARDPELNAGQSSLPTSNPVAQDTTPIRQVVRIVPPPTVDTSRIVNRKVIAIPHKAPSLPDAVATDSIAALVRMLGVDDANARARAAFALSEWRGRAVSAVPSLVAMLNDNARVSRSRRRTSDAWWAGDRDDVTSPGEEAAKTLLFVGRAAIEPLEQFVASHTGESQRRAQWALGLLRRFD